MVRMNINQKQRWFHCQVYLLRGHDGHCPFFPEEKDHGSEISVVQMIPQECFLVIEHVHGHGIHFPLRRDQWRWNLKVMLSIGAHQPAATASWGRIPGFKVTLGNVHLKILCFGLRSYVSWCFRSFQNIACNPWSTEIGTPELRKKTVRKNSCSPKKGTTNKNTSWIYSKHPHQQTKMKPSRNWYQCGSLPSCFMCAYACSLNSHGLLVMNQRNIGTLKIIYSALLTPFFL